MSAMTDEPRPLRAVFLDIGDTVMRPNPSWEAVYEIAFREFGVEVEIGELYAALRRAYHHGGWGIDDAGFEPSEESSFRRTVEIDAAAIAELGLEPMPEAFFRRLGELFLVTSHWHIFPDAYPTLAALKERGLTVGAVSNWVWNLPELLHALDLVRHFDFIAASSRIGFEKPHPRIFEWALEQAKARSRRGHPRRRSSRRRCRGRPRRRARRGADRPIRPPRPGIGARRRAGHHVARRASADRRRSSERPMSERWRCFVALPIGDELRAALAASVAAWRERPDLAGLRWTDPVSWHLTLAFLGSVEADAVPGIAEAVSDVAARSEPMTLAGGELGAFPSPGRATVAWYGIVDSDGILHRLSDDLRAALGLDDARAVPTARHDRASQGTVSRPACVPRGRVGTVDDLPNRPHRADAEPSRPRSRTIRGDRVGRPRRTSPCLTSPSSSGPGSSR